MTAGSAEHTPFHPVVRAIGQAIADIDGALTIPAARIDHLATVLTSLAPPEAREVAIQLIGFAQALHARNGVGAQPAIAQLAFLAATALSDPQMLSDAFTRAGLGTARVQAAIGAGAARRPVVRDAGAPSALDIRVDAMRRAP